MLFGRILVRSGMFWLLVLILFSVRLSFSCLVKVRRCIVVLVLLLMVVLMWMVFLKVVCVVSCDMCRFWWIRLMMWWLESCVVDFLCVFGVGMLELLGSDMLSVLSIVFMVEVVFMVL